MKLLIAGATGFIGKALVKHFLTETQSDIVVLGRSKQAIRNTFGDSVGRLSWADLPKFDFSNWQSGDVFINLCGANIGEKSWSESRKQSILESRVETTRLLAKICARLGESSPRLLNASAIGIYGLQAEVEGALPPPLTEASPLPCEQPTDFLSKVGCAWEAAAKEAINDGVPVTFLRFGVVIGAAGGVYQQLKLPYQLGLGGTIGSGHQPFTWVSLRDLVKAIDFIISTPNVNGPVNITAPKAVSQSHFAKAMAKSLRRPAFITTPKFLVRKLFGQMADELLLQGQHVVPQRLTELGFQFEHDTIARALEACKAE